MTLAQLNNSTATSRLFAAIAVALLVSGSAGATTLMSDADFGPDASAKLARQLVRLGGDALTSEVATHELNADLLEADACEQPVADSVVTLAAYRPAIDVATSNVSNIVLGNERIAGQLDQALIRQAQYELLRIRTPGSVAAVRRFRLPQLSLARIEMLSPLFLGAGIVFSLSRRRRSGSTRTTLRHVLVATRLVSQTR